MEKISPVKDGVFTSEADFRRVETDSFSYENKKGKSKTAEIVRLGVEFMGAPGIITVWLPPGQKSVDYVCPFKVGQRLAVRARSLRTTDDGVIVVTGSVKELVK